MKDRTKTLSFKGKRPLPFKKTIENGNFKVEVNPDEESSQLDICVHEINVAANRVSDDQTLNGPKSIIVRVNGMKPYKIIFGKEEGNEEAIAIRSKITRISINQIPR